MESIVSDIDRLISLRQQNMDGPLPIVGIGGCPGVGKTTFANDLQHKMHNRGVSSIVVNQDYFRLNAEERKQFKDAFDPRRIKWDQIHRTLQQIRLGKKVFQKPMRDDLTREVYLEDVNISEAEFIIFEGVYALGSAAPMAFVPYLDLRIYLETSIENIYTWKWARHQKKTIRYAEPEFFQHMCASLEDFALYVYPTRLNANYIVQKDIKHRFQVMPLEEKPIVPDFSQLYQRIE